MRTIHPESLMAYEDEIPDALLAELARIPAEVVPMGAGNARVMWRTADDRHLTADRYGSRWKITAEGIGPGWWVGSCMHRARARVTAQRIVAEHREPIQPDLFGAHRTATRQEAAA